MSITWLRPDVTGISIMCINIITGTIIIVCHTVGP